MPFGLWAQMGRRNRVRWGPEMLRDVAVATNFGTKIDINWLCVSDSDAIAYRVGLSGRPTECRYCGYHAPKGRCYGNHFGFRWAITSIVLG